MEKKMTGAVIVASQNLDQHPGGCEEMPYFIPMMPLDCTSVIKREIHILRKCQISPIIVVCGHQTELLKNHLSHNGVIFCEDKAYAVHSYYESLALGLKAAQGLAERVVVIPVEYPAFSSAVIGRLCREEMASAACFEGRRSRIMTVDLAGCRYMELLAGDCHTGEEALAILGVEHDTETGDAGIFCSVLTEEGCRSTEEYVKRERDSNPLKLKTKLTIGKEEEFFGPGVYDLLKAIDEIGSIQAAAAAMGMSYTKCWKILKGAQEQMGFPFVEKFNGGKNGGYTILTEEGRQFMERYHALNEDVSRICRNFFDVYFREYQ